MIFNDNMIKKISTNKLWMYYPFFVIFFVAIFKPADVIKSFISLPLFLILPYALGNIYEMLHKRIFGLEIQDVDVISSYIVKWFVGFLFIILITIIFQKLSLPYVVKNIHVLILALLFINIVCSNREIINIQKILDYKLVFLCILLGILPILIVRIYSPFPLLDKIDFTLLKVVSQPALRMIEHGYITDNPVHKPSIFILLGIVSKISNVAPLAIMWSAPFLQYAVYSLGLYLFGYSLTRKKSFSLILTFWGLFIMTGSSFIGIPIKLRGNVILYAIFPLILYYINTNILNQCRGEVLKNILGIIIASGLAFVSFLAFNTMENSIITSISIILALSIVCRIYMGEKMSNLVLIIPSFILFHFYESLIFVSVICIYMATYVATEYLRTDDLKLDVIVNFILFFTISLFIYSQITGLLQINFSSLSSNLFGLTSASVTSFTKYMYILKGNSFIILSLLYLSVFLHLFNRMGKSSCADSFVLKMVFILFFIYFLPEPTTLRLSKEIVPFMAYLLASSIEFIHRFSIKLNKKNSIIYYNILLIAIIVFGTVVPFHTFYSTNKYDQKYNTILTDYEYEVGEWIQDNTPENTRIISDFQTMQVLTPLSNRIWNVGRQMIKRELSEKEVGQMHTIKNDIFLANNSHIAHSKIYSFVGNEQFEDKKYLEYTQISETEPTFIVVITPKTSLWLTKSTIDPISNPVHGVVDPKTLKTFMDENYFELIYQLDEEVYIFKAKQLSIGEIYYA